MTVAIKVCFAVLVISAILAWFWGLELFIISLTGVACFFLARFFMSELSKAPCPRCGSPIEPEKEKISSMDWIRPQCDNCETQLSDNR